MGQGAETADKNIYRLSREKCGMSRQKAEDESGISRQRIERIECHNYPASPKEVLDLSRTYKDPALCNLHCALQCEIGREYVPLITMKDLSRIVLELLSSINDAQQQRDRLISIAADEKITSNELQEFVNIQMQLEQISVTVEALQLWVQSMLMSGHIDQTEYKKLIKSYKQK